MNINEAIEVIITNLHEIKHNERSNYLKIKNMVLSHDAYIRKSLEELRKEIREVKEDLDFLKADINSKF